MIDLFLKSFVPSVLYWTCDRYGYFYVSLCIHTVHAQTLEVWHYASNKQTDPKNNNNTNDTDEFLSGLSFCV